MTALPASGYISNAARTEGEAQVALEATNSFLRERLGAGGAWVDVATASTVDLGAQTGRLIRFTGTTSITSFGTTNPGDNAVYLCRAAAAFTLTNGANLITLTGANIAIAAGDVFGLVWEGSNTWRMVSFFRASGQSLTGSKVGQVVQTQTGAVATGTTTIPLDDTIPQQTEGDQYLSLAITPLNASSTLIIEVVITLANSAAVTEIVALFQDSTANALAAVAESFDSAGSHYVIAFSHRMTAGTTSSTTFKVRAGGAASGTTTLNGAGGSRRFGGVCVSGMTITEILP